MVEIWLIVAFLIVLVMIPTLIVGMVIETKQHRLTNQQFTLSLSGFV